MNLLPQVLSTDTTTDTNILELRDYVSQNKVKFTSKPRLVNASGIYYYNALPVISEDRDVYKKLFNIGTIKVNWDHLQGDVNEVYNQLETQYFVSIQVCDKDYTKVKFVNQEVILIVYSNEEKLKKDIAFYNRCFKTIEEQNKEKDSLKAMKTQQLKKLTATRKYKR